MDGALRVHEADAAAVQLRASGVHARFENGLLLVELRVHASWADTEQLFAPARAGELDAELDDGAGCAPRPLEVGGGERAQRERARVREPRIVRVALGALVTTRLDACGGESAASRQFTRARFSAPSDALNAEATTPDDRHAPRARDADATGAVQRGVRRAHDGDAENECESASETFLLALPPRVAVDGAARTTGARAASATALVAVRLPLAAYRSARPLCVQLVGTWCDEASGFDVPLPRHTAVGAAGGAPLATTPRKRVRCAQPTIAASRGAAGAPATPPRTHAVALALLRLGVTELAQASRTPDGSCAARARPSLPLPSAYRARLELLLLPGPAIVSSRAPQELGTRAGVGGGERNGGAWASDPDDARAWRLVNALPRAIADALQLHVATAAEAEAETEVEGRTDALAPHDGAASMDAGDACGALRMVGHSAGTACTLALTCRPLSRALAISLEARGARADECAQYALTRLLAPGAGLPDGVAVALDPMGASAWRAFRAACAALNAEVSAAVGALEALDAHLTPLAAGVEEAAELNGSGGWRGALVPHNARAVAAAARSDDAVMRLAALHDAWRL